jgi:hypothetical protein
MPSPSIIEARRRVLGAAALTLVLAFVPALFVGVLIGWTVSFSLYVKLPLAIWALACLFCFQSYVRRYLSPSRRDDS